MSAPLPPRSAPRLPALLPACGFALLFAAAPGIAEATPLDWLPAGDPIESELRVLDVLGAPAGARPFALRHLHTRPLMLAEIAPPANATHDAAEPGIEHAISNQRILRWIARDLPRSMVSASGDTTRGSVHGTTPRLAEFVPYPGATSRVEFSAGFEGRGEVDRDTATVASGSGLHARIAVQVDRWLAYSHVVAGQFERGRAFSDPVVAGTDVITQTEESYLATSAADGRWAVQFGRSRWHWGPGDEASLVLSRTSPALTGLALRASIPEFHLDFASLSATLAGSAGEQLAAHRIEWQPLDGLRFGVTEAARYHAAGWRPLYVASVIPYVLVQRLDVQDEPDSAGALRNNDMVSFDAAWRVAEGTRVYGELLVDDLHSKTNDNPDKLAWQLGLEGVGTVAGRRVTWGSEYTRLTRYVYTSFFGRALESQGRPLGFPTGPDARRLRVRGALDLGPAWQIVARAAQTDRGENGLGQPFVPGSPRPPVYQLEGVPERTRKIEGGVRWWPASGVDAALLGGWTRRRDAGHVPGANHQRWHAALELRLVR